ncbi:hypothetical protein [Moorena sp. SIO2C4]|nr:hypothetical protein [Moorena sp. SIO2C4]
MSGKVNNIMSGSIDYQRNNGQYSAISHQPMRYAHALRTAFE